MWSYFEFLQKLVSIGHLGFLFSAQFSHSVMSDSLRPHGLQHARPPCPSPTPKAWSSNLWHHPTISFSINPFSSSFQCFLNYGLFQWVSSSPSGSQSIGVSASTSVLPMNIQDWFPLGLTSWISLQSQGLSRVFSNTTVQKHQFFSAQPSLWSNSHSRTSTGKTIALTRWTFVGKVMSQLFNMLSRFVIAFLPGSKRVLISAAVTVCSDLGAQENIICHCFHFFPVYFP